MKRQFQCFFTAVMRVLHALNTSLYLCACHFYVNVFNTSALPVLYWIIFKVQESSVLF